MLLYGAVLALNGILVIAFELPLTRFTRKLSMRNMIAFGSLLTGGSLACSGSRLEYGCSLQVQLYGHWERL